MSNKLGDDAKFWFQCNLDKMRKEQNEELSDSESESSESETENKKPKGLEDIIRKRAEMRKKAKVVSENKDSSVEPQDVDEVIKKVQKRNRFKRKIKKGGMDDRAHKIIPRKGEETIYNENLEKIKSKRETECNVCQKKIYKGQATFNNRKKNIDICEDCMAKYLMKESKKPRNIDGVILRRSQRKRRKPARYR